MTFPYKWFLSPFATSGDKTAVPNGIQPDGSISYAQGWGPDYALDPATNPSALNIDRQTTNELFYDITQWAQYVQSGLPAAWIDSTTNGGSAYSYSKGARVLYTDGFIYESTVNANTQTPGLGVTNWARVRQRLSQNTTYYVNNSGGSNSNDGLTSGTPWLTLQYAADFINSNVDYNGYSVTLDARGAFTAGATFDRLGIGNGASPATGNPNFSIVTGTSASISTTTTPCLSFRGGFNASISGAITLGASSYIGVVSSSGAQVNIGAGIIFGACGIAHMSADTGLINILGNYTISGDAPVHIQAVHSNGFIAFGSGITVTASGTRTFSSAFALCTNLACIDANNASRPTFSGTFVGTRYTVNLNANIVGTGGGATVFPGNASGTTATGGNYT